jgi:multicomponent Na+:H+ antiporter subunit B
MTRRVRAVVALGALAVLGAVLVVAVTGLEPFGHYPGPYGDVLAKVVPDERHTGQLVAATVFDYRGFDTLGEEMILFAAACGCAALLRVRRGERADAEDAPDPPPRPAPSFAARAAGAALVGPVMVLGAYVIAHGHLTPGGGFSGGVVVSGALLLAYAAGQAVRLRRVGSIALLEGTEALGAAGFLALALGGLVAAGSLMENVLPLGTTGMLLSAGTIPVGNVAVGIEVAGAVALILAEFLEQALLDGPQ